MKTLDSPNFNGKTNNLLFVFQNWLIMTGKMPGPFAIEYVTLEDAYDNSIILPKCTAVALVTSSLSMLKVCVDLNLLRIHLKDSNIRKLAGLAFVYLPFFITNAMFRLSAISILITYINYLAILPVVFVIGMNILYAKKK